MLWLAVREYVVCRWWYVGQVRGSARYEQIAEASLVSTVYQRERADTYRRKEIQSTDGLSKRPLIS